MIMAAAAATRRVAFGSLAGKLRVRADWDAMVLPERTQDALRDLAGAMEFGSKVFADWGFGEIGRGRRGGVTALFAGASGTGKTMAAGLVAANAGYDVWRIDLSGLVSKYIGETEKNLEKVFSAARDCDAALFFDEADAIFGSRSEVKDAHDRYANIETAYLLQRLEDHEGPVILASNIASNIDQAFLRRLDFVIEFPIPDAVLRAEIWRRSLPASAPLGPDIDIAFLARQFVLAGGDIRSATLDAAFRAARLGTAIDMAALLRAVGRQMAKHGRVPSLAEFGRYRPLVEAAE
jgi:SpoVK/Ycf46/Vps4 family AAA+-type ATPase